MDAGLRQFVRERARNCCEYCGMLQTQEPLRFQVEHIRARQHGGADAPQNLALACHHCNLHKGPNLTAIDPQTDAVAPLFNPRLDRWSDHFRQTESEIVGLTAVGRATVRLLRMNQHGRVELRKSGS